MNEGLNRTRLLLLVAAVPLVIVLGVLAAALLTGGGDGSPRPAAVRALVLRPQAYPRPAAAPAATPATAPEPAATATATAPATAPAVPGAAATEGDDDGTRLADLRRIDVGEGAYRAAIFRPPGPRRPGPVVLFLHGWAAVDPARYEAWIAHLVGDGITVIYPAYQERPHVDTGSLLFNLLAATSEALARVELVRGRLVVAGHSAGGALAADYAASARQAGLPVPAGVFSVYPGRRIRGIAAPIPPVSLDAIPATTRLLVLAGDDDTAVGTTTAREITLGAPHARTELRIVSDDSVDDHSAPRRADAAAQAAFWAPLDELVAETAGQEPGRASGSAPSQVPVEP